MRKGIVPQKSLSMTVEARLVRMVRANLRMCNNKQWVHIIEYNNFDKWGFIVCELFEKKIYPKYPPRKDFVDDAAYYEAIQRITYEVSHEDIDNQKMDGVRGRVYRLNGVFLHDEFGVVALKCYKVMFLGVGEEDYWEKKEQIWEERETRRVLELNRQRIEEERLREKKRQEALSKNCCMKCKYYLRDKFFPENGYCQNKQISGSNWVAEYHLPNRKCFEKLDNSNA